jgi:hypothetical protein
MAVERPDASQAYDDDTLIRIIAERFYRLPAVDEITKRDITWILDLVQQPKSRSSIVTEQENIMGEQFTFQEGGIITFAGTGISITIPAGTVVTMAESSAPAQPGGETGAGTTTPEPSAPQPAPPAKQEPGKYFPEFYRAPVPGLDSLAGKPYNYPKGAVVAVNRLGGGLRDKIKSWGVINPNNSDLAMPDGYTFHGRVGE